MKRKIISRFTRGIRKIHLTRKICNHLLGREHTLNHRMTVGSFFIFCGVIIASSVDGHGFLKVLSEAVGWMIHGIGAMPFFEAFTSALSQVNNDSEPEEILEPVESENYVEDEI